MTFAESELAGQPTDTSNMKVLIAATGKAGNTWLEHLLSFIYDLPVREVAEDFNYASLDALGPRWVAHQHTLPNRHFLQRLRNRGVFVTTLTRHPGDVLVSLKNYLVNTMDVNSIEANARAILDDGDEFGPNIINYARHHFPVQVAISLVWKRVGAPCIAYEDLRADTVNTLASLTDRILPVPMDRVRAAVVLTSLDRMRERHTEKPFHFRKGSSGEWKEVLPQEIIEIFRTRKPYPDQFAALGYDLNPDTQPRPRSDDAERFDPFHGAAEFDNGVSLNDLILQLYLLRIPGARERWPSPAKTGNGSFCAWLTGPCEADTHSDEFSLLITNLGYEIYKLRPDLRRAYPDVFLTDRLGFTMWYLVYGLREYSLDSAFTAPVFSFMARDKDFRLPGLEDLGDQGV